MAILYYVILAGPELDSPVTGYPVQGYLEQIKSIFINMIFELIKYKCSRSNVSKFLYRNDKSS